MASPLAERLRRHVTRARLFPKAGTAIVAVSGGADSLALLDLLHDLAPDLGLTLVVAHADRSEEHTSELQSPCNLVCRLLLEKKKNKKKTVTKNNQYKCNLDDVQSALRT